MQGFIFHVAMNWSRVIRGQCGKAVRFRASRLFLPGYEHESATGLARFVGIAWVSI